MKINLDEIYYYFLTCNNKMRKDHITNEFKNYKLVEVNPIMNIEKINLEQQVLVKFWIKLV